MRLLHVVVAFLLFPVCVAAIYYGSSGSEAPADQSFSFPIVPILGGLVLAGVGAVVFVFLRSKSSKRNAKDLPVAPAQVRQQLKSNGLYMVMSKYEREIYEKRVRDKHMQQRKILREFEKNEG